MQRITDLFFNPISWIRVPLSWKRILELGLMNNPTDLIRRLYQSIRKSFLSSLLTFCLIKKRVCFLKASCYTTFLSKGHLDKAKVPSLGRSKQQINEINRLDKTVKQGSLDSYEDIYVFFRYFVAHGPSVNSFRNLLNWKKKRLHPRFWALRFDNRQSQDIKNWKIIKW